jgi:hypothetical protein
MGRNSLSSPRGGVVRVGVEGTRGVDVVGSTGRAIQIAVDAVTARGGGTVVVTKGQYVLEDSVRMAPDVRLVGENALLRRGKLVWSELALDADIAQREITPKNTEGWHEGMGLALWDRRSGWAHGRPPARVVGVDGGVLYLQDLLEAERYAAHDGRVVGYFPMIDGVRADRAIVEGFEIDAAVDDPQGILKDMRIGEVYFRWSPGTVLRGLTVRNRRGDGIIVAGASEDSLIEDCETYRNDNYGIHPGSHSARCVVQRCRIHHNGSDGLYICWGIRGGEFLDNEIYDNGDSQFRSGISIGHKDTDCLIARNKITGNKKYGICFRQKTEGNAAHRATVRENRIENNGSGPEELADIKKRLEPWEATGCGISVCGMTRDLLLERNIIRETRPENSRWQRHAVIVREGAGGVRLVDNVIEGHPEEPIVDLARAVVR